MVAVDKVGSRSRLPEGFKEEDKGEVSAILAGHKSIGACADRRRQRRQFYGRQLVFSQEEEKQRAAVEAFL